MQCRQCLNDFDLWCTASDMMVEGPFSWVAFWLIGSTSAYKRVELPPERGILVNLDHELGIPPDAEILVVHYAPLVPENQRGPLPFEMTNFETRVRPVPHVLHLYGATFGLPAPSPSTMYLGATYVTRGIDTAPARSLVEAASQYAAGRYDALLVPANAAVEVTVARAVDIALQSFVGTDAREHFLDDAATYSHQLNVMMPLLAHVASAPLLRDDLRGQLNRLRKLRNQMAHDGELATPIGKTDAARLLTAAVFGSHYARVLRSDVEKAQSEGRLPKRRR